MAGKTWRQYVFAGIVNFGQLIIGFVLGWSSSLFEKLDDVEQSIFTEPITGDQRAWVGSLVFIGAILVSAVTWLSAIELGRENSFGLALIPFLYGSLFMLVTTDMVGMYFGRVLLGAGGGVVFTLAPLYCDEIATDDAREVIRTFQQIFTSLGYVLVYVIGPMLPFRMIGCVSLGFVIIYAIGVYSLPESPRFYVETNSLKSGESLAIIRGLSRAEVQPELDKLVASVKASSAEKPAELADLFHRDNFKAVFLSVSLVVLQQLSGITPVFIYLTIIFEASGSSLDPRIATIIVAMVQLAASLVYAFVAEKYERRTLLLFSSCGASFAHILLAEYFDLMETGSPMVDSIRMLPLLALGMFVAMYCFGLGPLPWVIAGEKLPRKLKAIAMPLTSVTYWTVAFLLTRFFMPLADVVGMSMVFRMLSACCFMTFFFVYTLLPKTRSKRYQEMQSIFGNKSPKEVKGKMYQHVESEIFSVKGHLKY